MSHFDCSDADQRAAGIAAAVSTLQRGDLVVLPTDTVYGIAADAFTPSAVNALVQAKGRGRDMPVPVLVGSVQAAHALVEEMSPYGNDLIEAFWPGALTLVCRHSPSLAWDLGETQGTVALRMPQQQLALDVLGKAGPTAVSSANRTGLPPATTAQQAQSQLGDIVEVFLDDGPCAASTPSSIVDLTGPVPRVLREGTLGAEQLREVVSILLTDEED